MIQDAIRALTERGTISGEEAAGAIEQMMAGEATTAQIGAFLTALRIRGEARLARLSAVLSDKVGQMPPGIVNLLWLMPDSELAIEEAARAASDLQRLAERKDEAVFTRQGFEGAADFLKQYARLSGIALCGPDALAVWPNPAARHKLPPGIVAAISRLTV